MHSQQLVFTKDKETNIRIQNLTSKLAVPKKQMLLQSRSLQIQELEIASHIETYLIVSAITTFKRVSPIFHHR